MTRVLVDGRHLSLKSGTGISTYGRNVCQVAKASGYHVDVLYGEPVAQSKVAALDEIAFFDVERETSTWLERMSAEVRAILSSFKSPRPFPIAMTGVVETRQFASRLPQIDGIWNATNLYYNADVSYSVRSNVMSKPALTRVPNAFGSDIAHWTYPLPLRLDGARNVYTVHDLVPLRLPFTSLSRKKLYYRMIDRICRDADAIVTVSETSRRDILSLFPVAENKVVNTYQSVSIDKRFMDVSRAELEGELEGLHDVTYKEYILFYGAIEPKKNVGRLIEAYLSSGIDFPLLIVGKDGWLFKDELALLKQDNVQYDHYADGRKKRRHRVRRIDYVSFPQLVNLIRGARMVAMPSLYEGFGLPIVEAMMCGTPVLTSNVSATAEIAGDAAVMVDPYDTRSIRDGLVALCRDDALAGRLATAGLAQARTFSPQRHADRLSGLYADMLKTPPAR